MSRFDGRVSRLEPGAIRGVVPLHRDAFAGYLNVRFGDRYIERFFEWYVGHPDCAVALVAHLDGDARPAGYVVGVATDREADLVWALVPAAALGLAQRPWLVLDRAVQDKLRSRLGQQLARLRGAPPPRQPQPAPPCLGLIGIGVASWARGRGVARALMQAFEDRARGLAAASMLLSVKAENTAARALYASEGWAVPEDGDVGAYVYYAKTLA
jgi:ribosomal protein S18 acetylase RimI-like enzyme